MKALALLFLSFALCSCAADYFGRYDPSDVWLAVNDASPRTVRHYLQRGASPNTHDKTGWSILHNACWIGSPEVVEVLVAAGADVNATGANGFSQRFEAMWRDIPEIKQKVWPATRRATPLHTVISGCASEHDRQRIVRFLLAHGANTNFKTRDGFTVAALAAKEQPDILPLLQ